MIIISMKRIRVSFLDNCIIINIFSWNIKHTNIFFKEKYIFINVAKLLSEMIKLHLSIKKFVRCF